jgi:N-acetylglucosaminyl-diphospho-decaprenol L-rhamnosyltransferase
MSSTDVAAIYVAYRTTALQLDWIPAAAEVLVVHNDDRLDTASCRHPRVRHLQSGGNVGFGAGVNLAARATDARRLVLCNPDTELRAEHWDALASGDPDEVVTLRLVDGAGRATSVVNAYPTALSLLLTAYRAGRLVPRWSAARRLLTPLLGRWGRSHVGLMHASRGEWPMTAMWPSAAVLSVDRERFLAVGGFDEGFFLYLEDADLAARMAQAYPGMRVRLAETTPGVHMVSASARDRAARSTVDAHYRASARRYAAKRHGINWSAVRALIRGAAVRRDDMTCAATGE